MSQKRFTVNLSDVPKEILDAMVENIQLIESVIKKVSSENDLSAVSVSYIVMGLDEAYSGKFSIKSAVIYPQFKEGKTYNEASFDKSNSEKIRAELSKLDMFFYDYTLKRVKDENSRLGIKLDGL